MYQQMLDFVTEQLKDCDTKATSSTILPFRRRSEHTKRVFEWAKRLSEQNPNINRKALLTAAIFHDVGYVRTTTGHSKPHAHYSAIICEDYLSSRDFSAEFIDFVVFLVANHSTKTLLTAKDTPLELILLMEADLLDETGALSIIWDCMVEGAQMVQTFEKTYEHIAEYSGTILNNNPMVTETAQQYWLKKQQLVAEFIKQLGIDLALPSAANTTDGPLTAK